MLPAACNSAAPSPAVPIGDGASRKRLFDARKFVEAAMARQAARSIDDAHLARLKDALEANRRAIGDRTRFMQTDLRQPDFPLRPCGRGELANEVLGAD
jgi:hypothetical protein